MRALATALVVAALSLVALRAARASAPSPAAAALGTLTLESVPSGGLLRWYRRFVPTGLVERAQPEGLPVVVCFHGGGGNALNAIQSYGVAEEAALRGYVAVFPEGTGVLGGPPLFLLETWNGGGCCAYAMENGIDDVGFFADLLDDLAADLPIDRDRVFLTGMSNGAILCYRIAVERPDLVAAIAPVAGALEVGPPSSPVPILAVHGLLDENVPFEGGVGTGLSKTDFTSQPDSVLPFLAANGGAEFLPPFIADQALLYVAPAPVGGADTWYFLALDGGHTWPGSAGSPIDPSDPVHSTVPATPLLFDFFEHVSPR